MDRSFVLLAMLVLGAAALAGCLGNEPDRGSVVLEFAVHPPDESVENRSDIDDFQTLEVRFLMGQAYPTKGSEPVAVEPRRTFDLTDVVESGAEELGRQEVNPGAFEKWTQRLSVVEAIHNNGSQPEVHTPGAGIYIKNYPSDLAPSISAGETLRYRFLFAVTQDTEDIGNPNVPEGEYFLRMVEADPVT